MLPLGTGVVNAARQGLLNDEPQDASAHAIIENRRREKKRGMMRRECPVNARPVKKFAGHMLGKGSLYAFLLRQPK